MGAKTTGELAADGLLTSAEAQRTAAFTNNAGPLFILGAVAASMLGNPRAGYYIIAVHTASAVVIGLIFRFYKRSAPASNGPKRRGLLRQAVKTMRQNTARGGFGAILGGSVVKAMETMLTVGGFIILFCVIIRIVDLTGGFDYVITELGKGEVVKGALMGIIEMANGCKNAAGQGMSRNTVTALLFIISWGGLSVHAQSLSLLKQAGVSGVVYMFSKLLHAVIAAAAGYALYPLFEKTITDVTVPASTALVPRAGTIGRVIYGLGCAAGAAALLLIIVIVSLTINRFYRRKSR
jgi:sporulation integral membrane protein YlbJ